MLRPILAAFALCLLAAARWSAAQLPVSGNR
jgi:hypothetical protein